jgi:tmRNA-binding protein
LAENRKARHDYNIEDTIEAGIALQGTEIKSIRRGSANLKDLRFSANVPGDFVFFLAINVCHLFADYFFLRRAFFLICLSDIH